MASTPQDQRKPADHIVELKDLVVGYAKQETIDPLKTLKRYLGWGVAGAFLVAGGSVFVMLGVLRGGQAISPFKGNSGALSLVPYAASLLTGIVIIGLAIMGIVKDGRKGDPR